MKIKSFAGREIVIGILLAAADFEWTLRRSIIALGRSPTSIIRKQIEKSSGLEKYKMDWKREVFPRLHATLPGVIRDWERLYTKAYPIRHKLIHGAVGTVSEAFGQEQRDCLLSSSLDLLEFVECHHESVYGRLKVRRKPR